jgi:hypothetical protein
MKKLLFTILILMHVNSYSQKPKLYKEIDRSKVNYLMSILPTNDTARIYNVLFSAFPDLNIALFEPFDNNVATLLGNIIENCDTTILIKVLEKGANPNLIFYQKYPGLSVTGPSTDYSKHIVLTNIKDTTKIKILIKYGADINIPEIKSVFLNEASNNVYDKKYQLFVRKLYGNKVEANAIYNQVLRNAKNFNLEDLNDLLNNGASLDQPNLLYYSIEEGVSDKVIIEMINKGVNVNGPKEVIGLPIFMAIYNNKLEIIKAMVKKGLNLKVKGYCSYYTHSEIPIDYAIALKRTEIADYLFSISSK